MIVLDTNVITEMAKSSPDQQVVAWTTTLRVAEAALAATTVAEVLYGVEILPLGARRFDLSRRLVRFIDRFEILPFDDRAAGWYARIGGDRRAAGHPISSFDCQVAAIARTHGAAIATRDVGSFEGCGLEIVNPWTVT